LYAQPEDKTLCWVVRGGKIIISEAKPIFEAYCAQIFSTYEAGE